LYMCTTEENGIANETIVLVYNWRKWHCKWNHSSWV